MFTVLGLSSLPSHGQNRVSFTNIDLLHERVILGALEAFVTSRTLYIQTLWKRKRFESGIRSFVFNFYGLDLSIRWSQTSYYASHERTWCYGRGHPWCGCKNGPSSRCSIHLPTFLVFFLRVMVATNFKTYFRWWRTYLKLFLKLLLWPYMQVECRLQVKWPLRNTDMSALLVMRIL